MIAPDKIAHFKVGFLVTFVVGLVYLPAGIALCILAGAAKEIWDYMGHGTPEWLDFIATVAGGAVGAGLILLIQ